MHNYDMQGSFVDLTESATDVGSSKLSGSQPAPSGSTAVIHAPNYSPAYPATWSGELSRCVVVFAFDQSKNPRQRGLSCLHLASQLPITAALSPTNEARAPRNTLKHPRQVTTHETHEILDVAAATTNAPRRCNLIVGQRMAPA